MKTQDILKQLELLFTDYEERLWKLRKERADLRLRNQQLNKEIAHLNAENAWLCK